MLAGVIKITRRAADRAVRASTAISSFLGHYSYFKLPGSLGYEGAVIVQSDFKPDTLRV
jgi:hypothetical protein